MKPEIQDHPTIFDTLYMGLEHFTFHFTLTYASSPHHPLLSNKQQHPTSHPSLAMSGIAAVEWVGVSSRLHEQSRANPEQGGDAATACTYSVNTS